MRRLAEDLGVADRLAIAVVQEDDLLRDPGDVLTSGEVLPNTDTGRPLAGAGASVFSANVYLGSDAIIKALQMGANLIIAEESTDTGVTLGPVAHAFGWAPYEMGTPWYLAPDCIARFDSVDLDQVGPNRVRVSGIRGEEPPERLKVAISFAHRYRIFGRLLVSGPDALAKSRKAAEIFWDAAGGQGLSTEPISRYLRGDGSHPPWSPRNRERSWSRWRHATTIGTSSTRTSGPSGGQAARIGGRDQPGRRPGATARVRCRRQLGGSCLVGAGCRSRWLWGEREEAVDLTPVATTVEPTSAGVDLLTPAPEVALMGTTVGVPLRRLCLARSGDKGDTCNVGVLARSPATYDWMLDALTPATLKQHFKGICREEIERYELPNLLAVHFLLHENLGGGKPSIQFDAQSKTYARYLLNMVADIGDGLPRAAGE